MKPLKILISNDDGILANGIKTLAKHVALRGHNVFIVCPDQERSATGHALTIQSPIKVEKADKLFPKAVLAWGCSGTPADCVKLALNELLPCKPDLILSGVNHGPNLGTDVFCSGTVAAALEGTLENIPSIAISVASFNWNKFEYASKLAIDIAENSIKSKWPNNLLLNINIPACKEDLIGEPTWSRLSVRTYNNQFSRRKDPRGNTYFWLAGEPMIDNDLKGYGPQDWPSDVSLISKNIPSVSPLEPDLFWRKPIKELPSI
tara:strand:+ start:22774 stop:23559 length:786 start_codon:yes stop_codon:yes gene_type:complete